MALETFCSNCGAARAAGARFCASCGRPFDEATAPVPTPVPATVVQEPVTPVAAAVAPRSHLGAQLLMVGLIAIAVIVGGVLLLGGKTPSAPNALGAASVGASQPPSVVSQGCATAMQGLTDALTEIQSRLSVGMTYAVYSDHVATARVAYDRLKPAEIDAGCLTAIGAPEENALNEYTAAYTVWNDCVSKTGCTNDSIKAELQGHWTTADTLLAGVKERLP